MDAARGNELAPAVDDEAFAVEINRIRGGGRRWKDIVICRCYRKQGDEGERGKKDEDGFQGGGKHKIWGQGGRQSADLGRVPVNKLLVLSRAVDLSLITFF